MSLMALGKRVGSFQPPNAQVSMCCAATGGVHLTLAGCFDAVTDSDSLAVVNVFATELTQSGVDEVLRVCHCRGSYD